MPRIPPPTESIDPQFWVTQMDTETQLDAPVYLDSSHSWGPTHGMVTRLYGSAAGEAIAFGCYGWAHVVAWLDDQRAWALTRFKSERHTQWAVLQRENLWPLPGIPSPKLYTEIPGFQLPIDPETELPLESERTGRVG